MDTAIGQVDEPFQVTLLYSSCLDSEEATLALDSLMFVDCEAGTSLCLVFFSTDVFVSLLENPVSERSDRNRPHPPARRSILQDMQHSL